MLRGDSVSQFEEKLRDFWASLWIRNLLFEPQETWMTL